MQTTIYDGERVIPKEILDIDIMNEDFEVPVHTADLEDLIIVSQERVNDMQKCRKDTAAFKRKVNSLIDEYHERRGINTFCYV